MTPNYRNTGTPNANSFFISMIGSILKHRVIAEFICGRVNFRLMLKVRLYDVMLDDSSPVRVIPPVKCTKRENDNQGLEMMR